MDLFKIILVAIITCAVHGEAYALSKAEDVERNLNRIIFENRVEKMDLDQEIERQNKIFGQVVQKLTKKEKEGIELDPSLSIELLERKSLKY